ncbi:MAG: GNAT family N-acetyltransferase [Trueperaceae bacterium]|nr:GNAT family N-acetyltransferase [Trueperaceae bacterium]
MFRATPIDARAPAESVPWQVRAARSTDAEAWHALQRGIYAEGTAFVGDGAASAASLAARLRGLDPREGHVALAVARGEPIGWVEAHRGGSRRLAHLAILTVAVAPGWRGRGVGSALMDDARRWATSRRLRKLQLHVRAGNTGAIALYRRLGYEAEGVLREQVAVDPRGGGQVYEDEWVMALRLAAERP